MHWHIHGAFWPIMLLMFWMAARAMRRRRDFDEPMPDPRLAPPTVDHEAESAELADLRARVRVLERITVDERRSRDLATEIDALRDR